MIGELRQRLAEAVRRVLPVDPADGTVVVRFSEHTCEYGTYHSPVWRPADAMVDQIVEAVLGVVEPPAPPVPGPAPVSPAEGREAAVYQTALRYLDAMQDMRLSVAMAIAAAVEHGLTYAPEAKAAPGRSGGERGCGCDTGQCR